MARALSPKAAEWLEDMPPYYAEDPFVWAVLNAVANEYQRIEDAAAALLVGSFPQNAGNLFRLLGLWELQLGLAVEPDLPFDQRRKAVMGHLARRRASSERDWYGAMTERMGTTQWSYQNTGNGGIIINLPFGSDQHTSQAIAEYAREITPAHIVLAFNFGNGFILDYSLLDFGTF
jgi:hypothetical protein